MNQFRKDFPQLLQNPDAIYFDNAATTLKPKGVIDSILSYYKNSTNIHRGLYADEELNSQLFEKAREAVARYLGVKKTEIIFTSGATLALNLSAEMIEPILPKGGPIAISLAEHHSSLLPWVKIAQRSGRKLHIFNPLSNPLSSFPNDARAIIAASRSNILGKQVLSEIARYAKQTNSFLIIDGAQEGCFEPDVVIRDYQPDAFILSGHKMLAGTGVGILYLKESLQERLEPKILGGGAVLNALLGVQNEATWHYIDGPRRFEAGTPPIASVLSLRPAIEYLERSKKERSQILYDKQYEKLSKLPFIQVLPCDQKTGIFCFTMNGVHPHDIAQLLAEQKIAVRSGFHCAQPLLEQLGYPSGVVRASLSFYNTEQEFERMIHELNQIWRRFGRD